VGKGDTFIVPRNTPHWFSAIDGRLVMISMKLPDGPPAPQP
jgi:quercetin dioxygenase-like cupin family protein